MILFLLLTFIFCGGLTGLVRHYALEHNLLTLPNHRSSHSLPTPLGGGISFVACFTAAILLLTYWHYLPWQTVKFVLIPSSLVAFIGFLDDYHQLSAKSRLLSHFTIAAFALYLNGMPALHFLHWTIHPGLISNTLGLFYLVWLLNLYNFMDGINGIAGIEALTLCFSSILLYSLSNETEQILIPAILFCVVASFLIWNFPYAHIFMGDTGSGFLGVFFGLLSIKAASINQNFFWSFLIFMGVFLIDATMTLLRRAIACEPLYEAHSQHTYQQAARRYGTHVHVSLAVLGINLFWLLPLGLCVGLAYLNAALGLLLAYLPLLALACKDFEGLKKSNVSR